MYFSLGRHILKIHQHERGQTDDHNHPDPHDRAVGDFTTCREACEHEKCAALHEIAKAKCSICFKPIGYERPFLIYSDLWKVVLGIGGMHADCARKNTAALADRNCLFYSTLLDCDPPPVSEWKPPEPGGEIDMTWEPSGDPA